MIICGASAYSRVIDFKRIREIADKVGALMMADIAHIAGLVVTGHHPSPVPYADFVTTTTHKTLRGPRAGLVLCKEKHAKDLDRAVVPRRAGRTARAHHRGQGGGVQGSALAGVQGVPGPGREERQGAGRRRCSDTGFRIVSGGTDNHLFMTDVFSKGITGKDAQNMLEAANITVNKNTIPFDQNKPMVASGVRIGIAGGDHARPARAGDADHRHPHGPRARLEGRRGVIAGVKRDVKELCDRFPILLSPTP